MIDVRNVTMTFDEKPVLNKISVTFEKGQSYGILGPSGCGKSTLLKVVAGLVKPCSGSVFLKGREMKGPRKEVFMMHQSGAHFPWLNCIENVLLPLKVQGKMGAQSITEARTMLGKVGLEGHEEKLPHELTADMQQKLAFARVLVSKPEVVLLDEPTSHLDEPASRVIENLFHEMLNKQGSLAIVVTQNEKVANRMANKILRF